MRDRVELLKDEKIRAIVWEAKKHEHELSFLVDFSEKHGTCITYEGCSRGCDGVFKKDMEGYYIEWDKDDSRPEDITRLDSSPHMRDVSEFCSMP